MSIVPLETSIVTAGKTRAEAEGRSARAHILLVRRVKRDGLVALAEFMDARGMTYEIGEPPQHREGPALHHLAAGELPLAA